MTELYLNDAAVDLSPGTVIAITKQINDIADLQNRQADITNRFEIPSTPTNDKIFETAKEVMSGTLVPYRRFSARIRVAGIDIVQNGLGILETYNNDRYIVSVVSGIVDFFDIISGKDLQDLDLSSLDHLFDLAKVVATQLATSGIIYAIADYGDLPDGTRTIDVRRQGPSVFILTVLNAIFSEAGFTKSGDIFSDTDYTALILPFAVEKIESRGILFSATMDGEQITSFPQTIAHDEETSDPGDNYDNVTNFRYTAPRAIDSIQFRCQGSLEFDVGTVTVTLKGSVFGDMDSVLFSTPGIDKIYNLDSTTISLASGETVLVEVTVTGVPTVDIIEPSTFWNIIPSPGFSADIVVSELLPKMKQSDFIKAISNLFGLIPTFDVTAPLNVEFKKFEDIFTERRQVDWSDKLDESKPPEITFARGDYAQNNNLVWKEDPRNVPDGLGDGVFTIDDDNLPADKDVIQIPFSASDQIIKIEGINLANIIRFTDPEGSATWTLSEKVQPRLGIAVNVAKGLQGTFDLTDGVGTNNEDNITVVRFFDTGNNAELDGTNLLNRHYPGLILSLARTKIVTAFFRLTAEDVRDIDHFIPIYVQRFGAKFFLNKAINYIEDQPTKCELVRL